MGSKLPPSNELSVANTPLSFLRTVNQVPIGFSGAVALISQSPRRSDLLWVSGIQATIAPVQVSEIPNENLTLRAQIQQIATDKLEACLNLRKDLANSNQFALAADTVVVVDGKILGKPKDEFEAEHFLGLLSGRSHSVLTGWVLQNLTTGERLASITETLVEFRNLNRIEIKDYIATREPFDKAGGYGIQGAASVFVNSITGSFCNVVGLPVVDITIAALNKGWEFSERTSDIPRKLAELNLAADVLLAVSKTKSAEHVVTALLAGQTKFGENYLEEFLEKKKRVNDLLALRRAVIDDLEQISSIKQKLPLSNLPLPRWHFIGNLQSKKIKHIVGAADLIESVASEKHLIEIEKRTAENQLIQNVLLQLHYGDEESKSGFELSELETVLKRPPQKWVAIRGLMVMPPLYENQEITRNHMDKLYKIFLDLRQQARKIGHDRFEILSLGTTHDFQEAIAAGSNQVRLGTAVFGERS